MRPRVTEHQVGELTWHLVSGLFATAYMARRAWEDVEKRIPKGALGLYRHGPDIDGLRGCVVTVVTLDRGQAMRCARILREGEDYELDEATLRSLVARRAKVVLEYGADGSSGRVKWRHPERGARLTPEGDMVPPEQQG